MRFGESIGLYMMYRVNRRRRLNGNKAACASRVTFMGHSKKYFLIKSP
jgi:hypothetical protein